MPLTFYDPERPPDPAEWLSLGEAERIRLARNYHQAARIKVPNVKAHAAIHAAVENQIAMGFGPSCRAVERLQQEGLSRHDALHAIGSVVAEFVMESVGPNRQANSEATFQSRMNAAIDTLTAKQWKALAERGGR